jgi:hypothetical protein
MLHPENGWPEPWFLVCIPKFSTPYTVSQSELYWKGIPNLQYPALSQREYFGVNLPWVWVACRICIDLWKFVFWDCILYASSQTTLKATTGQLQERRHRLPWRPRFAVIYTKDTVTSVHSTRDLMSRSFERRNSGPGSDLAKARWYVRIVRPQGTTLRPPSLNYHDETNECMLYDPQ